MTKKKKTQPKAASKTRSKMAAVPAAVHERGWQYRPVDKDTGFAPPFGTIRVCIVQGTVSRLGEGGDLQMATVHIVATMEVEITSLSLSMEAAETLLASYEADRADEVL